MSRLRHDCAFVCALHLLGPVSHLLREEEKNELFNRYYDVLTATLEVYDAAREAKGKVLRSQSDGGQT